MSTTDATNVSIRGVPAGEGNFPSTVNNGMRAMVSQTLGALLPVAAGGTVDAITASPVPLPDALTDGMLVFLRATGANLTTVPTLQIGALTAHVITKRGGQALVAGDIPGAGAELILRYNAAGTRWELVNAAPPVPVPPSPISNSLGANVALHPASTDTYTDGPSVPQGSAGTWLASGTVTLVDIFTNNTFLVKLWDGATTIASCLLACTASVAVPVSLSGFIVSPAGNIRISVRHFGPSGGGLFIFNNSGSGKDSTVTAIRIG